MIDQALELGLGEPEETYSSSDHLYEMLNIPAGSNGRVVKSKPVTKIETPKVRSTERTRTRTKKFKPD
jgi:hypothetical protein